MPMIDEIMDDDDLIVSRAHEVVQKIPLIERCYKCMRCGLDGTLEDLFGEKRCLVHFEFKSSGWLPE